MSWGQQLWPELCFYILSQAAEAEAAAAAGAALRSDVLGPAATERWG